MKILKIVGIIVVTIAVILQLFPSKLPETNNNNPNDFLANNQIPDSIALLLKNGCYDCHSNETKYPWYSNVKPAAWLLARDTKVGREHLNLSEWESLSLRKKLKVLNEMSDEVKAKEMPLAPYMLIHKNARFTDSERRQLIQWIDEFSESLLN